MELRCPHCKTSFQVDENDYAAIAAQVRNSEFEAELRRRLGEIRAQHEAEEKVRALAAEKELVVLRSKIENYEATRRADLADASAKKAQEIAELAAEKDKEIGRLRTELAKVSQQREMDVEREKNASESRIHELNERHAVLLRAKDEEIARYKEMKSRLSTKLLGESLEVHCQTMFNRARSQGQYLTAYFEKDNDLGIGGTKGDFIFRDFFDGQEYISIMFEMKTEDDRTVTKHRNEDFFAKLDKDRKDKGCEYAVLVSTLEADSEFYNEGIVDVSYRYEKMLVIRPQFFMSVISLLSRTARRGAQRLVALRSELEIAKAQSIDVTNFEARRDQFVDKFGKLVTGHLEKQDKALAGLDKAIAAAEKQAEDLRKIKVLFEASRQKLLKASECAENDFTIKKLTRGNPTMKAKFEEARARNLAEDSAQNSGDGLGE